MNSVAPGFLNSITALALRAMALAFNRSKRLQGFMRCSDGWINFSVGIRTETGTVAQTISFNDGRVTVRPGVNGRVDVTLIPRDDNCLKEMATVPPNEMLNMMLRNQIMIDGNMAYLQLFNFYLSLLVGKHQQRSLDRAHRVDMAGRKKEYAVNDPVLADELKRRRTTCLRADGGEDKNVKYLIDCSSILIFKFPKPLSLSLSASFIMPEISSSESCSKTNTRERDSNAEFTSKDGFSVVAPMRITVPSST